MYARALLFLMAVFTAGCVLAPRGTRQEQARLKEAGKVYEESIERREIAELPRPAGWRDVLYHAFHANGDLEAAYFEWKAALHRIPQMATYPNANLAPQFNYMFSGERMKSWNRSTVTLQFDPSETLMFPTKVSQAGKVALDEARAAGAKFLQTKFDVQKKVLTAYLELVLQEQKVRIAEENVSFLNLAAESARDRVRGGGMQQDLLRAQTQYRLAENELANMKSERMGMAAMLNGMMGRAADAPITLPEKLPDPRPIAVDDARLIAAATDRNPELLRLAHEVAGRKDALVLAKMAYIPDINPMAAFTGSVSQMVGAMVMLPTTIPEIRGKIDEERAMLRASEAMLRQTKSDRAASFVAALYVLRNAERQAQVFDQMILPRAEQLISSSRQAYTTGTGTFVELIESQRMLLDVRQMIVESRIEREKRLAELEALAGVDIETLAPPTSAPTTGASK